MIPTAVFSQNLLLSIFDNLVGKTWKAEGTVVVEGKNIQYQYNYGGVLVTYMWEYVNDSTYQFTVGKFEDGTWKQTYLSTQFKKVEDK